MISTDTACHTPNMKPFRCNVSFQPENKAPKLSIYLQCRTYNRVNTDDTLHATHQNVFVVQMQVFNQKIMPLN